VYGFETVAKKKDGSTFYIRESARLVKDDKGNVLYYEGIVEDITSQKQAEEKIIEAKESAEQSDKLKTEFLAQMSHEIRTPINTLLSFSSLIREETKEHTTDDLGQYFHYQVSAGNRIIRTIDLVLNMSEIQTGSFQLNLAELNLADLIDEIYNDYKSIAEQNGLVINLFSQEDKMKIKADEYSVHQIFSNLIDNSIKYTPEGSVTLTAKKENSRAIIEVIDTGIGMTEEYLQNIFKPFTQEEQGYTRKFEGSGLGLSLVKKYCEFNNAKISVESKKNVGSKFIVSFNLME
jgi:signal transduction histidine kinase